MPDRRIRPWATGLPPAAALAILRYIPCSADRGKMAAVCRAWHALAWSDDPPPSLPWLLVPGADSTRVHCFLSDYRVHRRIVGTPHGSRCFGSYDGAWLFLSHDEQGRNNVLFRISDGCILALPDVVRSHQSAHAMAMRTVAATLCTRPDGPDCIGACIFTRGPDIPDLRRFAFWRMGSEVAVDFISPPKPGRPTPADFEAEDVAYFGGAFHILTSGEHVFVCQPVRGPNEQMKLVPQLNLFELHGGRERDNGDLVASGRYLVVSGMELLMVVRLTCPGDQWMMPSFRVFRMIPPVRITQHEGDDEEADLNAEDVEPDGGCQDADTDEDEDQGDEVVKYRWSWGELDTLDGRMLFVGRGCSRCYQVADYPGFTAGVYFSDDHAFYDEELQMPRGANERQYSTVDIGSSHSSAIWLLPPPRLSRLPEEMLFEITRQMRCDVITFSALRACRLKRKGLGGVRAKGQLPWLLLPSVDGISLLCLTCGDNLHSRIHPAGLPLKFQASRFCGSFDGRLVFLTLDDETNVLLNTVTGESYSLPVRVRLITREDAEYYNQIILAATLSHRPDDKKCIAAAIIRYRHSPISARGPLCQMTMWRMGSDIALDPLTFPDRPGYVDDLLFFNGGLHLVTRFGQLMIWTPSFLEDGGLDASKSWRCFYINYEIDDKRAVSRYLVESRGQLLLVLKFGSTAKWMNAEAMEFRVFRLTVPEETEVMEAFACCPCFEEPNLKGRLLFVGRGCSRSYELTHEESLKEGIYFSDDRSFYNDEMMRTGNSRQFTCNDNGKWVEGLAAGVQRCYTSSSNFEDCDFTPPSWLLP